jgi:hypothetical protein
MVAYVENLQVHVREKTVLLRFEQFMEEQGFSFIANDDGLLTYEKGSTLTNLVATTPTACHRIIALEYVQKSDALHLRLHYAVKAFGNYLLPNDRRYFRAEYEALKQHITAEQPAINLRGLAYVAARAKRNWALSGIALGGLVTFVQGFLMLG